MFEILKNIVGEDYIRENEPMGKHCTFRCGGNADLYVMPGSIEELSSNILSAVIFPAPDIPVTITKRMLFPPTSYIILTSGSNSTSNCSFTVAFTSSINCKISVAVALS